MRAQLVNGQSITLQDGTVVRPEQVVGPATPGPSLLLVDCPSLEYVPALLAEKALSSGVGGLWVWKESQMLGCVELPKLSKMWCSSDKWFPRPLTRCDCGCAPGGSSLC